MSYRSNEWHLRDPEAVTSLLKTDIVRGLEGAEVNRRRRRDGKNNIWHINRTSATEYALRSLGDLTSAVLVIAALTAAVFERSTIAAAVCVLVLTGMLLRVVTYVKARRILEGISDESIPNATVIRGGASAIVRADELVQGDIVLLGPGDIVPCDGRIVMGDEIRVAEQGITENKTSVIKGDTVILTDNAGAEIPCEYRVNMLFAGSTVLSGNCRIVATACGDEALVSMRHGGLIIPSGENVHVINRMDGWCRKCSVLMLICVLVVSGFSMILHVARGAHFSLAEAFIDAMALAAASVSSYLVTVGYITLTLPLRRISTGRSRAVVKDIGDIDKIADVKCIIASDVMPFKSGRVSFTSYFVDGELKSIKKGDRTAGRLLADMHVAVVKSDASASLASAGDSYNESENLFVKACRNAGEEYSINVSEFGHQGAVPIDYKTDKSDTGYIHNVILRRGSEFEIRICGSIREVLICCDKIKLGSSTVKMTDDHRRAILRAAFDAEAIGGNVVALARRDSMYSSLKRLSVLRSNMCFEGFAVIAEDYADGVKSLGREMSRSSLSVVLLSSNAELDRGYLAEAGIVDKKAPIVLCSDVIEGKELPSGSFIVAIPARSENGDKIDAAGKIRLATVRKLVSSISDAMVVTSSPSEAGMITDEVVGVAVSASNLRPIPQSLKRKSKISVYPAGDAGFGGFGETVKALSASICSLENLRRTVLYTVTSQTARLICTLLAILADIPMMSAANILLLGMIFDFLAVLVLAFSPERRALPDGDKARRQIPNIKDVMWQVLIGCVTGLSVFASVVLSSYFTGASLASGQGMVSASTIALILAQLVLLSEIILDGTSLARAGRSNVAYFAYSVISLLGVLVLTFSTGAVSLIGDVNPTWIVTTISAASSIVILAVYETIKLISSKNRDK